MKRIGYGICLGLILSACCIAVFGQNMLHTFGNDGSALTNLNTSTNNAKGFTDSLAGDVSGPEGATVLAAVGNPGTYQSVTTDSKGRVISGGALTAAMLPSAINPTSLTVGAATNVASFTLVQTNWIDGRLYTNQTGRPIFAQSPCTLTPAAIAGIASFSLEIVGVATNFANAPSLLTLLLPATKGSVGAFVPAGNTFSFTNKSTGIGNSSSIVNGGQYMVF